MIDIDFVIAIHDEILTHDKGLQGKPNIAALEGCLSRIDNVMTY